MSKKPTRKNYYQRSGRHTVMLSFTPETHSEIVEAARISGQPVTKFLEIRGEKAAKTILEKSRK